MCGQDQVVEVEVVTITGAEKPGCGLWPTEAGRAALEQAQPQEPCEQLYVDLVEEIGVMLAARDCDGLAVLCDVAVALTRYYV